ncbi:MAG: GNAT family N-acetyltransferase [Actinomycetota bacterium]
MLADALEVHQRELALRWATVQGGVAHDTPSMFRTVVGLPVSYTNQAGAARLTDENAGAEIEATEALLREHGVPGLWWVRLPGHPPDLGDLLLARGWTFDEEMPWMAASIDSILAGLPEPPEDLRIEAVEGDAAQARWLAAMTAGFGLGNSGRAAMTRLADAVGYGRDRPWRRFAGTMGGRAVGSSGLMISSRVAGIYNVATDPEFRRRGIASAMTGRALREARDRGYQVAILGASPMGLPVYTRMGFVEVCRLRFYEFDPREST